LQHARLISAWTKDTTPRDFMIETKWMLGEEADKVVKVYSPAEQQAMFEAAKSSE
jgi:hypothetical protein